MAAAFLTTEERGLGTGTLPLPRVSWEMGSRRSWVAHGNQPVWTSVVRAAGRRPRRIGAANQGLAGMQVDRDVEWDAMPASWKPGLRLCSSPWIGTVSPVSPRSGVESANEPIEGVL